MKTGGETFLLGHSSLDVKSADQVMISDQEGLIQWSRIDLELAYGAEVSKPEKRSKLKGEKSELYSSSLT